MFIFMQICSATLMEDDMMKAQSKVVDILCNLELIYPSAFFDIMIHLVIHLPLDAFEGGLIRPRWMFPFEIFMKKLKGYGRNKAKPKGSIAEGYVEEEALTFINFLRHERRIPRLVWVADKDPGVSTSSELFALACGPTLTPISVNSCVVNGVRFVVHSRDECRTTQNNGICSPCGRDGEIYYVQLQEILKFSYLLFKVVLFRVKWFDTSNEGRKVKHLVLRKNMTQIWAKSESFKDDQYILPTQVKQVFYLEDIARQPPNWKVVEHVNHKRFSNRGVIMAEDDPDAIHFDNSSDLILSTSLNDLDFTTLHIDGQSTNVDVPPNIIIDVDEDDDIIDDEDAIPHDLAYSDDEDLVNVDDDVVAVYSNVARDHDGEGGGDDHPPPHQIPTGCGGFLGNRVKGTRKPNLGGRKAGMLHTREETQNLMLKKNTDLHGPVPIRFEWNDRETMMPLGDHAADWANYLGKLVRELLMHYLSWRHVPGEQKAGVLAKIGTHFDLKPHMEFECCTKIHTSIQQHLKKIYNGNKAALKEKHWVQNLKTGTYNVESIRRGRPANISAVEWDAQIAFWNDPTNLARCAQKHKNQAKSTVVCRQGSRSLAALRDQMTFFQTHTVGGVFLRDKDRALYEEMLWLQGLGSNTETGVPYTDDEIMAIVRKGKQRGHLPSVGRVSMIMKLFRSDEKMSQMLTQLESSPEFGSASGSGGCEDDEQGDNKDDDEDGRMLIVRMCYIWVNIDLYLADNASEDGNPA
uniref:DUF4218 domain-containing protein n=1 Tax=Tanacetum cinerariifolium TaxID=118510 RepID=A0A699HXP8_TANCI|nr:hypothetical protein [Tanacetum cinerariifolium]